jgi:thiamine biosynthesis lipoprotein ApbE
VGIQHPWRKDALAAILEMQVAAIATSAAYERGPHLLDPATGRPATGVASATITGPSLALADALATAVAIGGDEPLAAVDALDGYEGYLIRADGGEADTGRTHSSGEASNRAPGAGRPGPSCTAGADLPVATPKRNADDG